MFGILWSKPVLGDEKKMRPFVTRCYRGSVEDKVKTLRDYRFTFAVENTVCPSYITEKIFDAMFASSVPVYLGAPDIEKYIPKETFVDMRNFASLEDLASYLKNMTKTEYEGYISAIKKFVRSEKYKVFNQDYFANKMMRIISKEFNEYV